MSQKKFLSTLPSLVIANLSPPLQNSIQTRQPWRWLLQFHFGEPRLHYEVSKIGRRNGWELGLHCESNDKNLNRFLLNGFRKHLFEIKDTLGESIEAEMWDKGWSKIYEIYPAEPLTQAHQTAVAHRLAEIILCIQPIFADLRGQVRQLHR
ncbi:MAG: hypothetical protein AAF490_27675 [Chloroflexota bacterium]